MTLSEDLLQSSGCCNSWCPALASFLVRPLHAVNPSNGDKWTRDQDKQCGCRILKQCGIPTSEWETVCHFVYWLYLFLSPNRDQVIASWFSLGDWCKSKVLYNMNIDSHKLPCPCLKIYCIMLFQKEYLTYWIFVMCKVLYWVFSFYHFKKQTYEMGNFIPILEMKRTEAKKICSKTEQAVK